MSDRPELVGIILCELVLQDVLRREAISCVNIIPNSVMTPGFPTQLPLMYAFAQLSGSKAGFSYQFKVLDPDGNMTANSPVQKVDPLPNENFTHKIINAFTGLTFTKEGIYQFLLEVDGVTTGTLPFQVVQAPPQATA